MDALSGGKDRFVVVAMNQSDPCCDENYVTSNALDILPGVCRDANRLCAGAALFKPLVSERGTTQKCRNPLEGSLQMAHIQAALL